MVLQFFIINVESNFGNKPAYFYSVTGVSGNIDKYLSGITQYTHDDFIREADALGIIECAFPQKAILEAVINKFNEIQDLHVDGRKFVEILSFEGVSLWPFVTSAIYFSKPQETLEIVEYLGSLIDEFRPEAITIYGDPKEHQTRTVELILKKYGLSGSSRQIAFKKSQRPDSNPKCDLVNELYEMIETGNRSAISAYASHLQQPTLDLAKICDNALLVSYPHAWRQTAKGEIDRFYEGIKDALSQSKMAGIRLEVPYYFQISGSKKHYIDSVLKGDRGSFKSLYFDAFIENIVEETHALLPVFEDVFSRLSNSAEFNAVFSWHGISFFTPLYEYWKCLFTDFCINEGVSSLLISRRLIQAVRPKCIFLIYETGCYGRALIIEAHRAGIPTFGLQHGYIFENHEYYMHKNQSSAPDLTAGYYGFVAPTKTLVWGEFHRRVLTQSGHYPSGSVEAVGNWMVDWNRISSITNEMLAEYRTRFSINNKKILLVISSSYFLGTIEGLAKKIDTSKYSVIIKIHPEEKEDLVIAAEFKKHGIDVTITSDNLIELILVSSIIVCDAISSAATDCLLLNKNITYTFHTKEFGYDIPWENLVTDIDNVTTLEEKSKSESLEKSIHNFLLDNGLSENNITITQAVIKNLSRPDEIDVLCYHNDLYKKLIINYDNFFEAFNSEGLSALPLIHQIRRISFELSNICNYSTIHKKCPLSQKKDKIVLAADVVQKTLTELGLIHYYGVIAFHIYNEPLIDPRLFDFIKYARNACPDAKILILTNGYYLDQTIADELSGLGVWIIAVSAYSKSEYARLTKLHVAIPYKVFWAELDDRESMYERAPINLQKPCCAPIKDLSIACTGEVILCCLDWKHRHTFGNLKHESLHSVLSKQEFADAARGLASGKRTLDLCTRCDWVR